MKKQMIQILAIASLLSVSGAAQTLPPNPGTLAFSFRSSFGPVRESFPQAVTPSTRRLQAYDSVETISAA